MKVSFLVRVSDDGQDEDIFIFAQIRDLGENPVTKAQVVVREYGGEAETGRTLDRPQFQQIIAEGRSGPHRRISCPRGF